MSDWYYIGHYGQLGPLTREQFDELIDGGVITRETYVWRSGTVEWLPAGNVAELSGALAENEVFQTPPPPPMPGRGAKPTMAPPQHQLGAAYMRLPSYPIAGIPSPKSRIAAGILNIVLPGVGRMYLGYVAYGVIQFVLFLCSGGILALWSIIDGILMLSGNIQHDGYGRVLQE